MTKKRVVILDVNGPLGDFVGVWLKTLRNVISEEERDAYRRLVSLLKEGSFRSDTEKTREVIELVERLTRPHTEELRNAFRRYLEPHRHNILKLMRAADEVILYSDMPHSVVKIVADALREVTGVKNVRGLGSSKSIPHPIKEFKRAAHFLLPLSRGAEYVHITDKDPPLPLTGRYRHIKGVTSPEMLPRIAQELQRRARRDSNPRHPG